MPDEDRDDQYRRFAETCLKKALNSNDQPTRLLFIALAQAWNSLADRNLEATTNLALEDFNQRQLTR